MMVRREARASITASGARNADVAAAAFGVPPMTVVVWTLLLEADGENSDFHIQRAVMVAKLVASDLHDPAVHHGGLNDIRYTVVTAPWARAEVWCPPYPGKATWTVVTPALRPITSPQSAISAPSEQGEAQ